MKEETKSKASVILAATFAENASEFLKHGVTLSVYSTVYEFINGREGVFCVHAHSLGKKLVYGSSDYRLDIYTSISSDKDLDVFVEWFEGVRAQVLADDYTDDVKVAE